MYITIDDIKHEVSLYYPIDNRNGNKKVGLIRAYFVYSFYNVENDEKTHLKVHIPPLTKFRPETPYGVKRSHAKNFQNRNCGFPTIKLF